MFLCGLGTENTRLVREEVVTWLQMLNHSPEVQLLV